ncbi:MAG: hypothetical protein QUV06_10240 [Cyanobium sp. CZS 48M]|nr:hypothetical protein [Cyanobium sp. CZS48M]
MSPLEAKDLAIAMEESLPRARALVEKVVQALGQGRDAEALLYLPDVLRAYGLLWVELPEARGVLKQEETAMLLQVLAGLGARVNLEDAPLPRQRADLCWQVPMLLERLRQLGTELPGWVDLLEEQLIRVGALQYRDLHQADPDHPLMRARALTLMLHLCGLHDPPVPWKVLIAKALLLEEVVAAESSPQVDDGIREQLGVWRETLERVGILDAELNERIATTGATDGSNRAAIDLEEQIKTDVVHWLNDNPAVSVPVELRLVCGPEARVVPHDRLRLNLNLAPLLNLPGGVPIEPLVEAFFRPMREQDCGPGFCLREPISSLYESLELLWSQGQELSLEGLARLASASAAWNRCGGPGALGARLLGSSLRIARLRDGSSVLRPEPLELMALQAVLYRHGDLEAVLSAIRRHHLDPAWMNRRREAVVGAPFDLEECLRRLHTEWGFYASGAAPLECLEQWSRSAMGALLGGQVTGTLHSLDLLPVAQMMHRSCGRAPELMQWPSDQDLYSFLAGKEVVLATTLPTDQVEAHHGSGRAFELFSDLRIAPYGLRCVQVPCSRYPHRPGTGFGETLEECLDTVDTLFRQRPFKVFVAACGAYGLPLCEAVHSRYGVSCLCSGDRMNAYFGMEQAAMADWRAGSRIRENWQTVAA